MRAKARVFAEVVPRHRRPAIVSFSGLDGSGKSTQVTELRDTLASLGVPADVQWAGFKTGSSIRAALPVLDRSLGNRGLPAQPGAPLRSRDPLVPAACLGHPLGQHLWMFTVVAVNSISLWRYVLKPRRGTKVVIFDRFSPDSAVKLDFHYGCNRQFDIRWQRALFASVSPKPDVGFLVAVSGDVAYARRQEQTLEELTVMSRLYDDVVPRFGLVRLDGTESADQLRQRVVKTTWSRMR
jgi:thymidylate kinase